MAGRGRGARPRDDQNAPRRPVGDQGGSAGVAQEPGQALVPAGLGRGAERPRYEYVDTRTAPDGNKRAKFQPKHELLANYFKLESRPDFHLYQYHVDYLPDIEHFRARRALAFQHEQLFGNMMIFDGSMLYSPTRLKKNPTEMPARRNDGSTVTIRYRLVGEVQRNDHGYTHVMNTIVRFCLQKLNLVLIRRDYFDPAGATTIPQHNLAVWPGYVTTIRPHDGGYLLSVEIKHKVLRQDTALHVIKKICSSDRRDNLEGRIKSELSGQVVMTMYNNKTYRIDDVDFTKSPMDTFFYKKEDREISYKEYYQKNYQIVIRDEKQPLLATRPSRRDLNRGDNRITYLIPELSSMTGLDDDQRNNIRVKNDLGSVTRVNPPRRVETLMKFRRRFAETPAIRDELSKWGLNFSNELVKCEGHIPDGKVAIRFGGGKEIFPKITGWSQEMQSASMATRPPSLDRWVIIFPGNNHNDVRNFYGKMKQVIRGLQLEVAEPKLIGMQNDRTNEYARTVREACMSDERLQLVMCVLKTKRADNYSAIKVPTLCDFGIPSQVITLRNMTDDRKALSIATKVMIQISAKLGGEPWKLNLPGQRWMIIGFDTYHDARQKKAVGAFLASVNASFSKFFSRVSIHENNEEMSTRFREYTIEALKAYWFENNKTLPVKIIVYRDGVGAGDISRVLDAEAAEIQAGVAEAIAQTRLADTIGVSFVIVSKRINTRFFVRERQDRNGYRNPTCGMIVDNTVTLPERFDFFLVSQNSNQGTVSPTSYNVVLNGGNLSPDIHQKLAYFLTHLYYNWAGTLSVPAPLQYAHKLAYLVGESLGTNSPHARLSTLPYYL